jgi:peptide methionine sulfoxide reductase MsrB
MEEPVSVRNSFDQAGRVTVVTGWPGLLGWKPAEAVAEMGGIPVLLDLHEERCENAEGHIGRVFGGEAWGGRAAITEKEQIWKTGAQMLSRHGGLKS